MMTPGRIRAILDRFCVQRRAHGAALADALRPLEPYPPSGLLLGVAIQVARQHDMTLDEFCAVSAVLWAHITKQTVEDVERAQC